MCLDAATLEMAAISVSFLRCAATSLPCKLKKMSGFGEEVRVGRDAAWCGDFTIMLGDNIIFYNHNNSQGQG